ncbi:MAG: helix-turn-helix transcriptional regulator [Lachnospiraceae bacterium]|nr:helix-turn-helix transcriptional regulator [Lachnospiraceae bacterium]
MNLPTIDMSRTGANIKNLRQQTGMSVKDLQDIFGFTTPQAIYKWQKGLAMPTVDNLVVLSRIFGVHLEEILVLKMDESIQKSA